MKEIERKSTASFARKTSEKFDEVIGVFSPKAQLRRLQFRAAYDALDRHRTRKKRFGLGGSADTQLNSGTLDGLREIHRELMRNNPIIKGLLKMERDEIIGAGPTIQARTEDEGWNRAAEQLWQEEMIDKKIDVTGRLNFNRLLRMQFLAYRRDGDSAVIFHDNELQAIEGDQMGTPFGHKEKEHYRIVNGVAYSKKTQRVIGYYIGKPADNGYYIKQDSYKNYLAERVEHIFNPERSSQSRGEPVLTSSIDYIDKLSKYIDAEVVAAAVNASFTMFISKRDSTPPDPYVRGISSSGKDEDDNRLEKMNAGTILYGEPGEDARGIGMTRPAALFDPFVLRMLCFIGRPLCIPLMLITLDYSGATFMNARIAYQQAQKFWKTEQSDVIKPFVSRVWRWFIARMIIEDKLKKRDDIFKHQVICNRWPYVDPYKESMANKTELLNRTITRRDIIASKGGDYEEVTKQLEIEDKRVPKKEAASAISK